MSAQPKPARRGPKPPRPIRRGGPIARRTRPRQRSLKPKPMLVRTRDEAWSLQVRIRAEEWCEWCRRKRATDAHHVKGKLAHPNLRYVLDNGVAVDRECHQKAHGVHGVAWARRFKAWFEIRFPERWAKLEAAAA